MVWFRSYIDKKYASVYQNMFQLVDDVCKDDNMEQLAKEVDVILQQLRRDSVLPGK